MELIQIEQFRLDEKERYILDNAFYIINQMGEKTDDYELVVLTSELIGGLTRLKGYYK